MGAHLGDLLNFLPEFFVFNEPEPNALLDIERLNWRDHVPHDDHKNGRASRNAREVDALSSVEVCARDTTRGSRFLKLRRSVACSLLAQRAKFNNCRRHLSIELHLDKRILASFFYTVLIHFAMVGERFFF